MNRFVFQYIRHSRVIVSAMILLILCGIFLLFRSGWSSDVTEMLPEGSESAAAVRNLRESGLMNRTILLFESANGNAISHGDRLRTAAENLRRIPGVRYVFREWLPENPAAGISELLLWVPQLISPDTLEKQSPEKRVRKLYQALIRSAPGASSLIPADPVGLTAETFRKADNFRKISGFQFNMESGLLISRDGKFAMMVLETDPVVPRDFLKNVRLASAAKGFKTHVISPLVRAEENEKILKRDIQLVAAASVLIFGLLFATVYLLDFRTLLIPAIPFAVSAAVLGFMPLIWNKNLLFIAGLGGIVVSLAVDYGIHIFGSMRARTNPLRTLPVLFRSLLAGAGTSAGAFVLFLLSRSAGMRQLGFFAGISLILCMFLMFALLPWFFLVQKNKSIRWKAPFDCVTRHPQPFLAAGLLILLTAAAVLLSGFQFKTDVRAYDAAVKKTEYAENLFHAAFPGSRRMAVVLSPLSKAAGTAEILRGKAGIQCFCFSDIYPDRKTRTRNLKEWQRLAGSGRLEKIEKEYGSAARKYGFRPEIFARSFSTLKRGIQHPPENIPPLFEPIRERMISGRHAMILLADGPSAAGLVRPGNLISGPGLPKRIGRDLMKDLALPALLAVLFVFAVVLICFRTLRDTLCALLPPIFALSVTAAVYRLVNGGIDFSVLISMTILAGVSVDYGIFVTTAFLDKLSKDNVFESVSLSALTTAAGGATVIFAEHPVLRAAGFSILTGCAAAWCTAVFLIPAVMTFFRKKYPLILITCLPAILLTGCYAPITLKEPVYEPYTSTRGAEDELFRLQDAMPRTFITESGMVAEYKGFQMSVLALAKINMKTGNIAAVIMNPAGAKFAEVNGTAGNAQYYYWFPNSPWSGFEKQAADIALDCLSRIYLNNIPPSGTKIMLEDGKWTASVQNKDGSVFHYVFAGSPVCLVEKSCRKGLFLQWKIRIYKPIYAGRCAMPGDLIYDDIQHKFRLTIRTRKIRETK